MATDITVPALGESINEATVGRWLKQQGDSVEMDEPVVELETDKVTLEVHAPVAGTIAEVLVQEGESVEVGALLGRISEGAGAEKAPSKGNGADDEAQAEPPKKAEKPAEEKAAPGKDEGGHKRDDEGERVDIAVPSFGESVNEATLAQWLKRSDEAVAQDEAVAELETDKVTLEVNAPVAGTLVEQLVKEGDTVEVGGLIGRIAKGAAPPKAPSEPAGTGEAKAGEARTEAPAPSEAKQAPAAAQAEGEAASRSAEPAPDAGIDPNRAPRTSGRVTRQDLIAFLSDSPESMRPEDLSPAVRKLVRERGVDPTRVPATGPGGRLTKEDVIDFLEGRTQPLTAPSEAPENEAREPAAPPTAQARPSEREPREERVKMTRLRQTIAKRLKEAQTTAAMLTTFNEVDMTAVNDIRARYRDAFEKAHGTRLGMSCFFAKAVVRALEEIPEVNARIEGDEIVYNHYYDIGMAVSTPNGLMVPVVRDVDGKSMAEIEAALRELAQRGREGKLKMEELQGATFSITNGGVFGSLLSTPILNTPQSGILGMHRIQQRPMAVNGKVEIRPMMYVALSYDHRIVDGREAVTFLVRVKECLEDPARLLLQM